MMLFVQSVHCCHKPQLSTDLDGSEVKTFDMFSCWKNCCSLLSGHVWHEESVADTEALRVRGMEFTLSKDNRNFII